ncbi:MAG: FxSxx-COOH cyclophane-containing RiPP peptide [Actinocrinis sp.]
MEIAIDTKSDLISGVADVRHVPLSRLAREDAPMAESLKNVLPADANRGVAVAAFNSSI